MISKLEFILSSMSKIFKKKYCHFIVQLIVLDKNAKNNQLYCAITMYLCFLKYLCAYLK